MARIYRILNTRKSAARHHGDCDSDRTHRRDYRGLIIWRCEYRVTGRLGFGRDWDMVTKVGYEVEHHGALLIGGANSGDSYRGGNVQVDRLKDAKAFVDGFIDGPADKPSTGDRDADEWRRYGARVAKRQVS